MTTNEIREILETTWTSILPMTQKNYPSFRMKILDLLNKVDQNVGESETANERRKKEAQVWIKRLQKADNLSQQIVTLLSTK